MPVANRVMLRLIYSQIWSPKDSWWLRPSLSSLSCQPAGSFSLSRSFSRFLSNGVSTNHSSNNAETEVCLLEGRQLLVSITQTSQGATEPIVSGLSSSLSDLPKLLEGVRAMPSKVYRLAHLLIWKVHNTHSRHNKPIKNASQRRKMG